MPKFEVSVPHSVGKEAALDRLQRFSELIQEKHSDKIKDYEEVWTDDQLAFAFKTLGMRIAGTAVVDESDVQVAGDLPFAAAMFKGQITTAIQEQLERLLS